MAEWILTTFIEPSLGDSTQEFLLTRITRFGNLPILKWAKERIPWTRGPEGFIRDVFFLNCGFADMDVYR